MFSTTENCVSGPQSAHVWLVSLTINRCSVKRISAAGFSVLPRCVFWEVEIKFLHIF